MSVQRVKQSFSSVFSWRDFRVMTMVLVTLNLVDVISSFYAINFLGFVELNPLAVSFPIWIFVLKFGICFVPIICVHVFRKIGMENYLFVPFAILAVLIGFYAFVVGSNVQSIIG